MEKAVTAGPDDPGAETLKVKDSPRGRHSITTSERALNFPKAPNTKKPRSLPNTSMSTLKKFRSKNTEWGSSGVVVLTHEAN